MDVSNFAPEGQQLDLLAIGQDPERLGVLIRQMVRQVVEDLLPPRPEPTGSEPESPPPAEVQALRGQIDLLQLRQERMHQQISNYEAQISQLQQEKQALEAAIEELPELYRQKFQVRLAPIRDRIQQIRWENQMLRQNVQELNARLARQFTLLGRRRPRLAPPKLPALPPGMESL